MSTLYQLDSGVSARGPFVHRHGPFTPWGPLAPPYPKCVHIDNRLATPLPEICIFIFVNYGMVCVESLYLGYVMTKSAHALISVPFSVLSFNPILCCSACKTTNLG